MKNRIIPAVALIAALAVTFSLMMPRESTAQDSVVVKAQGVENRFPDGLRFYIDAESPSAIDEIRVYVRKLGQSSRITYRSVEFEPGNAVNGEVMFESKTSNEYIPPGTRLEYHFDIRTADGASVETEPENIVYLNTGLDWNLKSSGLINVYYYHHDDQSEPRADAVLQVAADTYEYMQPILGVELTEPMSIVVYSNYSHMRHALNPSSRVAATQLRTLGQAFTNERTLLVDGSNDLWIGDNTVTTAAHEFTHLLVADAAGSAYGQVHTWLNEGLAVYSERQPESEYVRYMRNAIRNDQVPPLVGLRTFAGTPQETLRAYGQGHAVVQYMLAVYHPSQMVDLFDNIREIHNFEKALVAAYGLTVPELDNEWRRNVGLAPRDLSTPPPPPLQVLPTSRPTPTPPSAAPVDQASGTESPAATAIPADPPAPTYTPKPPPTRSSQPAQAAQAPQATQRPSAGPPAQSGGCGAAPSEYGTAPAEMASLAVLAAPLGLVALAAFRRRR